MDIVTSHCAQLLCRTTTRSKEQFRNSLLTMASMICSTLELCCLSSDPARPGVGALTRRTTGSLNSMLDTRKEPYSQAEAPGLAERYLSPSSLPCRPASAEFGTRCEVNIYRHPTSTSPLCIYPFPHAFSARVRLL